jgi:enoyl-[acyl-carrier protein] reductase II
MSSNNIFSNSAICRLLGIKYPILQAGMGQVAYGALTAAVSEAGGLGVIGAGANYLSAQELLREIEIVRERTDKPFGVDILFGRIESTDEGSHRYSAKTEELIEVTLKERVPVLISGLGNPAAVIDRAHAAGATVMSVVGNVRQAQRVVASGVDAVIASGHEGGGHVGRVGTISLIPAVVDAVDVPVVAGGGLADGRGLVAAMALGASAVWLGTRFIATHEARGHDAYKDRIVDIDDDGTTVSRGHSGKPARLIKNAFTAHWEEHGDEIHPFPQQLLEIGEPASVKGRLEGDIEDGVLPAGQSAAMIHEIKGAAEVVADIVAEAREVLRTMSSGPESLKS